MEGEWSQGKPTESGWYWYREGSGPAEIIHVDCRNDFKEPWCGDHASEEGYWLSEIHGPDSWYSGPLFPPPGGPDQQPFYETETPGESPGAEPSLEQ